MAKFTKNFLHVWYVQPITQNCKQQILGMPTANLAHTVNMFVLRNFTPAIDSLLKVLSKHPLWKMLCFVFNLLLSILGVHDVCCSFCDMLERPLSCKNSSRYPSHYWGITIAWKCQWVSQPSTRIYYKLSRSILGHFEGSLGIVTVYPILSRCHECTCIVRLVPVTKYVSCTSVIPHTYIQ